MRSLSTLLAVALSLGFAPAPPPRPDGELRKAQGRWVLVDTLGGWFATGRIAVGEPRVTIKGDRIQVVGGKAPCECVLTLDAGKNPRRYVETPVGTVLSLSCRGIYSLEGDTLRFSCNDLGEAPPTSFEGRGKGRFLVVYKHQSWRAE